MKILLINVSNSKGSTGNIVTSLFNAYKELGHDPNLIYGRGPRVKEDNVYKPTLELESKSHHLISLFTGNMYGGMHISTRRIISRIKKINPDVIHLHCLNGYFVNIYKLISWLKKSKDKVILTHHADFMLSSNCGYTEACDNWKTCECRNCKHVKEFNGRYSLSRTHKFYKKMYRVFKDYPTDKLILTGVSPWLSSRIKESPIYSHFRVETILNPVDDYFLKKLDIKRNDKQILYVTPDFYDQTKSGHYLIDIASKLPEYKFILATAKRQDIEVPSNVEVLCSISKEKLRELYQSSRCTLLLSKRETFSMVALESIASGTPVIGFKNGGTESWLGEDGFVDHGDISSLIGSIKNIDNIVIDNKSQFSRIEIARNYIKLI